jgi:hypothetical protein
LNWRQESAVMKRSVGRDSISLPLRPRTEIARKRWLRIRRVAPIWCDSFNAARAWCIESWRETSISLWQNEKSSWQALARFLLNTPRCDFSIVAGLAGNLFS